MGQLGFFDADKRLQALSARGDPLEAIDHLVPWESYRAEIEAPCYSTLSNIGPGASLANRACAASNGDLETPDLLDAIPSFRHYPTLPHLSRAYLSPRKS